MAVIVAVAGSVESRDAVLLAAREAAWRDAPLVCVTAYRGDHAAGTPAGRPLGSTGTPEEDRRAAESTVEDAVRNALGPQGARVDKRTVEGPAGRALIDTAQALQAQLVVLSARPGVSVLPGSVSHYVLRHAPCPVLVVPRLSARREDLPGG